MNAEYMTISEYVEVKSKLIGKIATYDALIDAMEKAIMTSTVSGHLVQVEVDDGMMKVRSNYRSVDSLTKAMTGLIRLREMYINQYNGRTVRLVGGGL